MLAATPSKRRRLSGTTAVRAVAAVSPSVHSSSENVVASARARFHKIVAEASAGNRVGFTADEAAILFANVFVQRGSLLLG
jgi:hypothetical protein